MDNLFSKFTIAFWMWLISGLSLGIFLTVVALNYSSIGIVQTMNLELQNGPLEAKSRWLTIAQQLSEAEKTRLLFRAAKSAAEADAVAEQMSPLLAEVDNNLAALQGTAVDAVKNSSAEYAQSFGHIVEAVTEKRQLRKELLVNLEGVEDVIYSLDNTTLEGALLEFNVAEMRYLAEPTADLIEMIDISLDRFSRDVTGLAEEAVASAAVEVYRKTFHKIVAKDVLVADRMQQMVKSAELVDQMVHESVAESNQQAQFAAKQAREKAISAQHTALLWTGFGVFLAVLLSAMFNRVFQRRINLMLKGFATLSSGDLRFRFEIPHGSENELCQINTATNDMIASFSVLLSMVSAKVTELNIVAVQLTDGQQQLLAKSDEGNTLISTITQKNEEVDGFTRNVTDNAITTQHQATESQDAARLLSDNISNIAAASEEASTNVTTMAAAAEQMTGNLSGVHQNLEQTSVSVSHVAKSISMLNQSLEVMKKRCEIAETESNRSKEHVVTARQVILRLEESTREISMVIELINDIAEQTNMLALNATIEAAGAGEAGKGFTVVANEVKALARQTADATKLIAEKIEGIQDNTQDASISMDAVEKGINQVGELNSEILVAVNEQNQTSGSIAQSIGVVSGSAEAVFINAKELTVAAEEVARAASEAAMGTNEIARSSTDVTTQSMSVAENSKTTKDLAEEVTQNTKEIILASETVKGLGTQMQSSMQELQQVANDIAKSIKTLQSDAKELEDATQTFKTLN